MINNARVKSEDMEGVTRKPAYITSILGHSLLPNTRMLSLAVTRIPYLGYMGIKSPAEMLQDAKDAFREAATSSLDDALNIYPIQTSPID